MPAARCWRCAISRRWRVSPKLVRLPLLLRRAEDRSAASRWNRVRRGRALGRVRGLDTGRELRALICHVNAAIDWRTGSAAPDVDLGRWQPRALALLAIHRPRCSIMSSVRSQLAISGRWRKLHRRLRAMTGPASATPPLAVRRLKVLERLAGPRSVRGALLGLALVLVRRRGETSVSDRPARFGPALAAATWLVWLFVRQVAGWRHAKMRYGLARRR